MFEEVFDLLDTNSSIGEVTYFALMVPPCFGTRAVKTGGPARFGHSGFVGPG
jgi:hypothetical protein